MPTQTAINATHTTNNSAGDWHDNRHPTWIGETEEIRRLREQLSGYDLKVSRLERELQVQRTSLEQASEEQVTDLQNGIIKVLRLSGIVFNLKAVERICPDYRKHIRYFAQTLMDRRHWVKMEQYLTSDKAIDRAIGTIMWDNTKDQVGETKPVK